MVYDFINFRFPIGQGFEWLVNWLVDAIPWVFDGIRAILEFLIVNLESILLFFPEVVIIVLVALLAWRLSGRETAIFVFIGLILVDSMSLWPETMKTFALILASTITALVIGIPLGILSARNNKINAAIRPILDFMQTMPAFVYLIPAVIFFGMGRVPGAIATVIFSMPPAIRLTNLGIRQVPKDIVEAARAFGATPNQLLSKVQLPLALPTIMAGVNQCIMLALSMVVIASMIGAGGLGGEVLRGITRLEIGIGFEGGLAVVLLAMILDRITQALGQKGR